MIVVLSLLKFDKDANLNCQIIFLTINDNIICKSSSIYLCKACVIKAKSKVYRLKIMFFNVLSKAWEIPQHSPAWGRCSGSQNPVSLSLGWPEMWNNDLILHIDKLHSKGQVQTQCWMSKSQIHKEVNILYSGL